MTDGHCFISYSNADGLTFASQLANDLQGRHPNIKVWFDKNDLDAGEPWDTQIAEAIRACKCLAFVMTDDSVTDNSVCRDEWTWALKYKKPIIPLHFHVKADLPFRLNNLQYIDFVRDFDSGIAQLRQRIIDLDSPEGILAELKHRLADAERDLRRAKGDEENRIKAEIDELRLQLQTQQKTVDNPKAAEKRTDENIKSGIERERQPEKPSTTKTSTKFINPPPGIAPNYFQDRLIETKQIVNFLNNDTQRLMTIVGRAGVGKTAMICRLLKGIESGTLPDDLGDMKADGIVYLSETGSHRVNFANIFADLSKLLPNDIASKLDDLYKDAKTSTGDKMRSLVDNFSDGRFVLLLDNFETLVDSENLNIRDSELSDALNALLTAPQHAIKVILTTRIAPRDLALVEAGRQHPLNLDEGLESPYAENILREMDADGRVGLKTAPDALLNKAREKTRGYPRALEALYAILSVDRYTTLEELLEISLPEEVVQKLVGEAFNRLDPSAQKVMQALAVYNRPVSPAAIDYLLQPHLPSIDSALVLNRLVSMHFARREAVRYYLHPADREYALSTIPEIQKENFTQYDLTLRAADYFAQARKPRGEWKKLDDLNAQLAEFELRCEAGDYDTAATVLLEIDFDYLLLWGHYRLAFGLYERIYKNINDNFLHRSIIGNMGTTCYYMAKYQDALSYHRIALKMAEEEGNKLSQAIWVNWIANSLAILGKIQDAIIQYELSLKLAKDMGRKKTEGIALGNLAGCFVSLGNAHKSIEYFKQALAIAREISDKRNEMEWLGRLGTPFADLGDANKAIEYYEQALVISHEIGNRSEESINLENRGNAFLSLEEYQKAKENYQQAIQIADDISSPSEQQSARNGLAQAYLFQNDLVNAGATIEAAIEYDVPENNHNVTALHGIIALRQGERETAQEAFSKSIAQADEILAKTPDFYTALDAKGLALCGSAICRSRLRSPGRGQRDTGNADESSRSKRDLQDAIETFRAARVIAPHAGVVKRVLRLFDELVKCDEEGVLKDVRQVIDSSVVE